MLPPEKSPELNALGTAIGDQPRAERHHRCATPPLPGSVLYSPAPPRRYLLLCTSRWRAPFVGVRAACATPLIVNTAHRSTVRPLPTGAVFRTGQSSPAG